ncbi:MAG: hypothetical protein AB8H79_15435 [Myxococcota bacterium]
MRIAALVLLTTPALAGKSSVKDEGIPLVVTVVDANTGQPVPFAAVRESQEKELHPVNKLTGQFATTMLYPSYNDEIVLAKDMKLVLEVTAPTYGPEKVDYTMRKRGNRILVRLTPMDIPANIGDEPVWQFGRDQPIGGRDLTPEELKALEAEMEEAKRKREAAPQ